MPKYLEKIERIIRDRRTQLPTLPVIVDNILKIGRDERTSAKDLAEAISKDQAIVNKTLKLANSAYYGFVRKIDTISHAIALVGFNEIISLTLGMSIFSAFQQKGARKMLDMKGLWLHSVGCAFMAKKIAKKTGRSWDDPILLSGLLHDTGKVILAVYLPEEYSAVIEDAKKTHVALHRKEQEKLGLNHAMVGGLLMERWNLPDNLRLPCSFHHNSAACPLAYRHHAMVVELANLLCQKTGIGYSGNPVMEEAEGVSRKLGLTPTETEVFAVELESERANIENFFELMS